MQSRIQMFSTWSLRTRSLAVAAVLLALSNVSQEAFGESGSQDPVDRNLIQRLWAGSTWTESNAGLAGERILAIAVTNRYVVATTERGTYRVSLPPAR